MKVKVLLFCICACILAQCKPFGDEVNILKSEQEEETPQMPEELVNEDPDEHKMYEKTKCLFAVKTGEKDDIVGKWKLALEINGSDTIDRSCEDIVYHFKKDGTLTVSGNTEVCEFNYSGYPFCPSCYPPKNAQPNLKMCDTAVFCQLSSRRMNMCPQIRVNEMGYVFPDHKIRKLFLRIE
jgi:hypothetical protein